MLLQSHGIGLTDTAYAEGMIGVWAKNHVMQVTEKDSVSG